MMQRGLLGAALGGLYGALLAFGAPPAAAQGVTTQCIVNVAAQGSPDAITSAQLPCGTTTTLVLLTAAAANITTTPTYAPVGSPPLRIVGPTGGAIAAGALQPNYVAMLSGTGTSWILLNPPSPGTTLGTGVATVLANPASGTGGLVAQNGPTLGWMTLTDPGGLAVPTLQLTSASGTAYTVPNVNFVLNSDYGSFGDTNTHIGMVVIGGKGTSAGNTTGSWQLFTAAYRGYGGGTGSSFITAGQELMQPITSSFNLSGRYFGNNPECILTAAGYSAATSCTAEEADVNTGNNTPSYKFGLIVADIGSTADASIAAVGVAVASTGAHGFNHAILFGDIESGADFPVLTNGSLIDSVNTSVTLSSFFDLSNISGVPTSAALTLPADITELCFGAPITCAGGKVSSTATTGGMTEVFGNNIWAINQGGIQFSVTNAGNVTVAGGVNAANATSGTASGYVCTDVSGNWFAQAGAC